MSKKYPTNGFLIKKTSVLGSSSILTSEISNICFDFFSNANALKKQQQQIFKIRHVQIFDIIWLTLSNSNLLVWKIAFFQLFITIFRSCCWRLRKNKRMILVHYIGKCCHGVNIVDNLNRSPHSGHFGLIVSKN